MARKARIVSIGTPHHITQRGNYKRCIFENREDYIQYSKWIEEYRIKNNLSILSYCLMPNHVHFIVIPGSYIGLSKLFSVAHMRYSQYINKRKNEVGHLWQGRFYSMPLSKSHLLDCIKYVEKNAERAKLVKSPEDWEWSSAFDHIKGSANRLITVEDISSYFEIDDWSLYLSGDIDREIIENIKFKTYAGLPLGDDKFIKNLEKELGRKLIPCKRGRPKKKN